MSDGWESGGRMRQEADDYYRGVRERTRREPLGLVFHREACKVIDKMRKYSELDQEAQEYWTDRAEKAEAEARACRAAHEALLKRVEGIAREMWSHSRVSSSRWSARFMGACEAHKYTPPEEPT